MLPNVDEKYLGHSDREQRRLALEVLQVHLASRQRGPISSHAGLSWAYLVLTTLATISTFDVHHQHRHVLSLGHPDTYKPWVRGAG